MGGGPIEIVVNQPSTLAPTFGPSGGTVRWHTRLGIPAMVVEYNVNFPKVTFAVAGVSLSLSTGAFAYTKTYFPGQTITKITNIVRHPSSSTGDSNWSSEVMRVRTICWACLTSFITNSTIPTLVKNHTTNNGLFFDSLDDPNKRAYWPETKVDVPVIIDWDDENNEYFLRPEGPVTFPFISESYIRFPEDRPDGVLEMNWTTGVCFVSPNLVRYTPTSTHWRTGVLFFGRIQDLRELKPNCDLIIDAPKFNLIRNLVGQHRYFRSWAIGKLLMTRPDLLAEPLQYTGWLSNTIQVVPVLFPAGGGSYVHDELRTLSWFEPYFSHVPITLVGKGTTATTYESTDSYTWPAETFSYNGVLIYDDTLEIPLALKLYYGDPISVTSSGDAVHFLSSSISFWGV